MIKNSNRFPEREETESLFYPTLFTELAPIENYFSIFNSIVCLQANNSVINFSKREGIEHIKSWESKIAQKTVSSLWDYLFEQQILIIEDLLSYY